ncbi:hypothetical protein C8J57DRAFT_1246354 [Mycena rebaudengoi]|nr:hypothetical protein C8J57DRAFT_1246354 [Mycena rebaudengoi]
MELTRWTALSCALVFFAFFGFAVEARKNYRTAFWAVAKCVGYTRGHLDRNPKPVAVTSIAIDAYAPSPTSSSFTDTKRPASADTESFASTTPTYASSSSRFDTTPTPTSRFLEHAPYPPLSRAHSLV